jgi:hypothetical protein
MPGAVYHGFANEVTLLLPGHILIALLSLVYFRRQIWTEELVRHLRERLEA